MRDYIRTRKMYKEAIFKLAILNYCLEIKGKGNGLIIMEALKNEIQDLYNYTMPNNIKPLINQLVNLGLLEVSKEGYINISDLGIENLRSNVYRNEIATLNLGLQNIIIQYVLLLLGVFSIIVAVLKK
jgi:hypothetical protein